MRLPDEPEVPPQINIVPMIDVVFAILTFFIISTLSLTSTGGLPINLPKASTSQQGLTDSAINVTVDAKGQVSIDGKSVDIKNLTREIQELVGDSQDELVIVSADENGSYGRVIAVMDSLRQVPGVRIAVATKQP